MDEFGVLDNRYGKKGQGKSAPNRIQAFSGSIVVNMASGKKGISVAYLRNWPKILEKQGREEFEKSQSEASRYGLERLQ